MSYQDSAYPTVTAPDFKTVDTNMRMQASAEDLLAESTTVHVVVDSGDSWLATVVEVPSDGPDAQNRYAVTVELDPRPEAYKTAT